MEDVKERLIKCFSAVFPELSPHEIVMASPSTTGAWDSLTAVTLLAVVEEEFGIELELNGKLENMSFESILARVPQSGESQVRTESAHVSTAKLA